MISCYWKIYAKLWSFSKDCKKQNFSNKIDLTYYTSRLYCRVHINSPLSVTPTHKHLFQFHFINLSKILVEFPINLICKQTFLCFKFLNILIWMLAHCIISFTCSYQFSSQSLMSGSRTKKNRQTNKNKYTWAVQFRKVKTWIYLFYWYLHLLSWVHERSDFGEKFVPDIEKVMGANSFCFWYIKLGENVDESRP